MLDPTRSKLIEPELRQTPPRPVRWTRQGRRVMLFSVAPVVAILLLGAALFASKPQPRWALGLFAGLVLAGSAVLGRLLLLWRSRAALVAKGVAVPAAVIEKEPGRRRLTQYFGWYQAGGKQWAVGWLGEADDAEIGDTVTVLYSATNPAQAVAYRASGCAAMSRGGRRDHSPVKPRI